MKQIHLHSAAARSYLKLGLWRPWLALAVAACALWLVPLAPAGVAGSIAVYPTTSTVELGGNKQFSAYVPISPSAITWSVNNIPNGNASVGTISSTGLYVPPATAPVNNIVTIKATSVPYPAQSGSATVTLTRKYPWLWGVNPSSIPVGSYSVSLNGSNFAPDSVVLVNGAPVTTTFVSATKLLAAGTFSATGTATFAVKQPGNGSVTGNASTVTITGVPVKVAVSPTSTSVALGKSVTFTSTVTGSSNTAVQWSLVSGGGSIHAATGVYTAPAVMPASVAVTVRATSLASPAVYAQATLTLTEPPPPPVVVTVSSSASSVGLGKTAQFAASVTGAANTAVTWSVVGGSGNGSISTTGLYTAPGTMPSTSKVTIVATSVAKATSTAQATITLTPPAPTMVNLAHARFLEQSSFGPSPQSLAEVGQKGIVNYLNDQLNMPLVDVPAPTSNNMGSMRTWAMHNYTTAPDQLRQRVAYSLGQIVVTSANKLIYPNEIHPWLRLLNQYAFGNYKDFLRDITKSASMGKYLDLANSKKPNFGGGANENYPRELLQLFTIGLWQLDDDGSLLLDANDQPIPTYSQADVQQLAVALTGWVYAGAPANASMSQENWTGPMVPSNANHDFGAKTVLGHQIPSGQSVEQDLESVLTILMDHPNIAPFICTRLIRSLVKSNPSSDYIARVSAVFVNNGSGVKGDLKAVVKAILLDAEALDATPHPQGGRLKEPILHAAGFLRAMGGYVTMDEQIMYLFDAMQQVPLTPPSVFNWFSPLYRIPLSPTVAPEFQIYSPTEASLRGNFFYGILSNPGTSFVRDLTPFQPYGNDMPGLVEAANQTFLYGRMPAAMKQAIIQAAAPGYDAKARIETVLYLTVL
ncbi:MAG: DUF1800 family protein, partial [Roseimicrobium sp.]